MFKVRGIPALVAGVWMFAAAQAQAATVVVSDSFAPNSFVARTVTLGGALGGQRAVSGRLVVDAYRFTTVITRFVVESSVQQDGYLEEWVALYEEGFASADSLSISGASTSGSPPRQVFTAPNTGYPMYSEFCSGGFVTDPSTGGKRCSGQGLVQHSRYGGRDVTEGFYSIALDLTAEALEEINTTGGLTFNYQGSIDYYGGSNISRAEITLQTSVPEPATWALLIGGFGATGAVLRRRRLQAAQAI